MKTFLVCLAGSFLPLLLSAQVLQSEIVATSGAHYGNSNFSMSWTVGDLAIGYLIGTGYSASEGFQQGFPSEASPRVSQNEMGKDYQGEPAISGVLFYPNPVTEYLFIELARASRPAGVSISLTNSIGVVLETRQLTDEQKVVSFKMGTYVSGIYFIRVSKNDGSSVIKKVIK